MPSMWMINVYGGLQDNGVWYGPSNYIASKRWNSTGSYPYKRIGGGDGMQVQIDKRDNKIVYSGSQFGYYYRINLKTEKKFDIHPKHELGDSPYRYNWQTPILLSPHNNDILYMGANKLLRSMDKGESFEEISDELTTGGKKGNVPYGTLTTISESPFQFGVIYTGSDDGYVNVTTNGGASSVTIWVKPGKVSIAIYLILRSMSSGKTLKMKTCYMLERTARYGLLLIKVKAGMYFQKVCQK